MTLESPITILCALPPQVFGPGDDALQSAVRQLKLTMRRASKGVSPQEDARSLRRAYRLAGEIARTRLVKAPKRVGESLQTIETARVGRGYLRFSQRLRSEGHATLVALMPGCGLVEPGYMSDYVDTFRLLMEELREADNLDVSQAVSFLERHSRLGCGCLELTEIIDGVNAPEPRSEAAAAPKPNMQSWETILGILEYEEAEEKRRQTLHQEKKRREAQEAHEALISRQESRFLTRARAAIDSRSFIDALGQAHTTLTNGLGQLIKRRPGRGSMRISIAYGGSAPAADFPLACLEPLPAEWQPQTTLHVALMSMRHVALDPKVHFAWYQNFEIPTGLPSNETDGYCYQRSRELLAQVRRTYDGQRILIYLHHTGLEPAVVGFYRAAVETMIAQQPSISLITLALERWQPSGPLRYVKQWLGRIPHDYSRCWLRVIPVFDAKDGSTKVGDPWPPMH